MVTKSKATTKKKKIKMLSLNKETVKDLTARQRKKVKGGATGACLVNASARSIQSGAAGTFAQSLGVCGGSINQQTLGCLSGSL